MWNMFRAIKMVRQFIPTRDKEEMTKIYKFDRTQSLGRVIFLFRHSSFKLGKLNSRASVIKIFFTVHQSNLKIQLKQTAWQTTHKWHLVYKANQEQLFVCTIVALKQAKNKFTRPSNDNSTIETVTQDIRIFLWTSYQSTIRPGFTANDPYIDFAFNGPPDHLRSMTQV